MGLAIKRSQTPPTSATVELEHHAVGKGSYSFTRLMVESISNEQCRIKLAKNSTKCKH